MTEKAEKTQLMEIARKEAWNKTPFSYLRTGSKLTLLQQDTMLMISDYLQQYIKDYFDLGLNKAELKPRPLFTKYLLEHGIPPFKIYLADMGINPSHYRTVREAIEEMNMLVEHPEINEQGKPTGNTVYSPVFTKFTVPQTGDFYRKVNENGDIIVESARHSGYIEVEINKDVAQYAFDMSQGYANHPKLIARYATKQSTPKLYFLLQELMGKGQRAKVKLTVREIKRALGFESFKDDATGEWVVPYAKFAHFKTKVLDAVKADLDRMASENHTDITFTYEPVYLNGRRRGDPDFIEFTVVSTDLGIGYSLLTKKDTPATDEAKDLAQKAEIRQQEMAERFERCKRDMLNKCTRDKSREIISSLTFIFWDDNAKLLSIHINKYEDWLWLEQPRIIDELLKPLLFKHFGAGMKIKYECVIPKPKPT